METTRRPVFQQGQEDLSLSKSKSRSPAPTLYSFPPTPVYSSFLNDVKSSRLVTPPPRSLPSRDCLQYQSHLILDKHAPVIHKLIRCHSPSNTWFTPAVSHLMSIILVFFFPLCLSSHLCPAEHSWKCTNSDLD